MTFGFPMKTLRQKGVNRPGRVVRFRKARDGRNKLLLYFRNNSY